MRAVIKSKNRGTLYAQADLGLILLSRKLEGFRKWVKGEYLIFTPTPHNLNLIREIYPELEIERINEIAPSIIGDVDARSYKVKTKPYSFQKRGFLAMAEAPGPNFALFCDPGTGKSKMAIDRTGFLWTTGDIDSALVIAPKGVHDQWIFDQIPTHCGSPTKLFHWYKGRLVNRTRRPVRGEAIRWMAINYDAIKSKNGALAVDEFLRDAGRFIVIFDESHLVKNDASQRWKAASLISDHPKCTARLLLTGTPIAKDLTDEWAQLKLIDESILDIRFKTHFRNEYCVMSQKRPYQVVVGARNLDRFKEKTRPYIFRATKADLPDLPPKVYSKHYFSMTPAQHKIYNRMKDDLIAELESGEKITAKNAAVKVSKLQQISNGFLYHYDEDWKITKSSPIFDNPRWKNPRIEAVRDILGARENEGEAIIIWCRFREDIRQLAKAFPNSVQYHNGISDEDKSANLETWLDEDGPPLLLATPGSGGTGLNLQGRCSTAIYYSNSEHSILRWQSEDRIHRIGSSGEHTRYIDLVARASRDTYILANLKAKKDLASMTLDDFKTTITQELRGL